MLKTVCMQTQETDMVSLFQEIHGHPVVPLHGPEHHSIVPAVILACYRNVGGEITEADLDTAISRGQSLVGGACGFMGICGAAVGVGIAYSVIMQSTPLQAQRRQISQRVVAKVLDEIAKYEAARCCQRDSVVALGMAADLSETMLPITLPEPDLVVCAQSHLQKECIGLDCPLFPLSEMIDKQCS
jgi:hypothetical protein